MKTIFTLHTLCKNDACIFEQCDLRSNMLLDSYLDMVTNNIGEENFTTFLLTSQRPVISYTRKHNQPIHGGAIVDWIMETHSIEYNS